MSDVCDARTQFVHALGRRAFDEVWIAELRFEFCCFGLKFLLFAIKALALLFEVDQAFEWNCQFNTAGYDLASLGPDGSEGGGDDVDNWTQQ